MDHALSSLYTQLATLAAKHGAQKLVLFGSRARGDHTERSDIDLAVYGMPPENRPFFCGEESIGSTKRCQKRVGADSGRA